MRVALMILSLVAVAAAPAPEAPRGGNGLKWEVGEPATFAKGDAYFVRLALMSDADHARRKFTLHEGGAVIELRNDAGVVAQTRKIRESGLIKALDGGLSPIIWIRDVREHFGELEPGKWSVRVVVPKGQYKVEGHADSPELSAEASFEIVATTKDDADRANAPTKDVALHVERVDRNVALARLTNNTRRVIQVSAYTGERTSIKPTAKKPLLTIHSADRFVPTESWKPVGFGWCGTGVGEFRLRPGESIHVSLMRDSFAQFVRYRQPYKFAGSDKRGEAISEVVQWPPTPANPEPAANAD